jgi:hypothetical protein
MARLKPTVGNGMQHAHELMQRLAVVEVFVAEVKHGQGRQRD